MRIKILACLYIALLIIIVWIADHREYHHAFDLIRALPYGDKVGHFLLMGMLAFVVNLLLKGKRWRIFGRYFLAGSVIALLCVVIEECSQLFIRYRTFDWFDLLADAIGIFLFGRLAAYLSRKAGYSYDG